MCWYLSSIKPPKAPLLQHRVCQKHSFKRALVPQLDPPTNPQSFFFRELIYYSYKYYFSPPPLNPFEPLRELIRYYCIFLKGSLGYYFAFSLSCSKSLFVYKLGLLAISHFFFLLPLLPYESPSLKNSSFPFRAVIH